MSDLRALLVCAAVALVPAVADAQLQEGTIQGAVLGPDGSPIDGVVVTLLDGLGEPLTSVTSETGQFRLTNVAPGNYSLRADAPPFRAILQTLVVGGALPIEVDLRLSVVLADQIVVQGRESPESAIRRITIAGDAVRRAPARLRARGLQDAIATTPGWSTEDNGLLHVRGVDDGFLYVIDGVPVYERLDGLFGVAPDPAMIDSVNVMTGYIPPEFGFKAGGVIEVRSSAARTSGAWRGTLDVGGGSDDGRDFSTVVGGPLGNATALTFGIAGQTSSRFLDPVHPDNLHNNGGTSSGGGQFGWNLSSASILTGVAGFGRSNFDVPHGEEQEDAGQDHRQQVRNYWQTVSWQHSWSADTISQVAGYHRGGSSALIGSPEDTPLFTNADRTLRRMGVLASVTHQRGAHVLKMGAEASRLGLVEDFTFAVTDPDAAEEANLSDAVMEYTREQPFIFREAANPTLLSFFAQDSIRAANRLTVDVGLRADWSRMLTLASQWSPRVGASYHWPLTQTTVRGSFGRFFQPPQPENLLLASSEQARQLSPFAGDTGGGGAELTPERQTAVEVAVNQTFAGRMRLDASYWHRRIESVADPNVFFGTTIIFPNTVAKGRAKGIDVRLEVPRGRGWSGYLSYTNSRVVQFGPITGGLFLEEEVIEIGAGTAFTPDHDQRNVVAFGVSYEQARTGSYISLTGRYASGTPLEVEEDELDELADRPGAELVDFDRGRVKPRHVFDIVAVQRLRRGRRLDLNLRFALLNLTGEEWAYNFGNPFSGTHFGHGRTVQVGFRAGFQ